MGSSGEEEVSFRFNNIEFSDRVLRLEITSNTAEDSNTPEKVSAADPKIKKIHIDSLILAYNSQFFYKLFKNGMKETHQKDEVVLKIYESEESAFMDLVKFIYDHSVSASSATDLVDVLMAADKFEVPSCLKCCVELLHKLPMSTELAVCFLGLPSTVLADQVVQTLIVSAKNYIEAHYRDFTTSQEEAMGLSLGAVELVLGRDNLQVDSEDAVFDFILKWGRLHYPEHEERQEILTRLLLKFISLPNMTSLKLKELHDCSDFNSEKVCKPVVDALFSKNQDAPTANPTRIYYLMSVKVVQLQYAVPRCVAYFDLTKQQCADLVPEKRLYTETFCLGGRKISLFVTCTEEPRRISTGVRSMEGSESLWSSFQVIKKYSTEFKSFYSETGQMPWKKFMSDDSDYFINGILHLRVDIYQGSLYI